MTNDTEVLTLTDFLRARIAEDEAVARATGQHNTTRWQTTTSGFHSHGFLVMDEDRTVVVREDDGGLEVELCEHIAHHDPARVLAECAAKRAIVEKSLIPEWEGGYGGGLNVALVALASVYADSADYRAEWAL